MHFKSKVDDSLESYLKTRLRIYLLSKTNKRNIRICRFRLWIKLYSLLLKKICTILIYQR